MADNTISSFLVALGFKIDESTQRRFEDALNRAHKMAISFGKELTGVLTQFGNLATAATGAATGVAAAMIKISESMAQLGFQAMRTGADPNGIKAIDYALQQVGGRAGEAQAMLESLADHIRIAPNFLQIFGVKPGTDPVEALVKIGEHFQDLIKRGMGGVAQQQGAVAGFSPIEVQMLANPQLRQQFAEELARQRQLGLNYKDLSQLGIDITQNWKRFQEVISDIGDDLFGTFGPQFRDLLKWINGWFDAHMPQIKQYITDAKEELDNIVKSVTAWWNALTPAQQGEIEKAALIVGMTLIATTGLRVISALTRLVGIPISPTTALLTALAGAIFYLYESYERWKSTGQNDTFIDWAKWGPVIDLVIAGIEKINSALKWIGEQLGLHGAVNDAFALFAEYLAGKWLISVLASMTKFSAGVALATGKAALSLRGISFLFRGLIPLLGLLGTGAAGGEDPEFSNEKNEEYKRNHPQGGGLGGWLRGVLPHWMTGAGYETPIADQSMTPEQQGLLKAISAGESQGNYGAKNPNSSAAGRYQFIDSTDRDISQKTGLQGQDPVSQDKKAWYLAATTYRSKTGRDLQADLASGGHEEQINAALRPIWPSLPGGSQANRGNAAFLSRITPQALASANQNTAKLSAGYTPPPAAVNDAAIMARPSASNNNVHAPTTVTNNINGVSDPQRVAGLIERFQRPLGADVARNLQSAIA